MDGSKSESLLMVCFYSFSRFCKLSIFGWKLLVLINSFQMHGDVQLPSPLVLVLQMNMIRFHKYNVEGCGLFSCRCISRH